MKKVELLFDTDGTIRMIYDDGLRKLMARLGKVEIRRASHVEPDHKGKWWADMSPVDGPRFGPYDYREQALIKEVLYLQEKGLPFPQDQAYKARTKRKRGRRG